jgi:hypothetical protein
MSSISSIPPFSPEPIEPKAPDPKIDVSAEDTSAPQPPVLAPLPPGQGTRIDQLV